MISPILTLFDRQSKWSIKRKVKKIQTGDNFFIKSHNLGIILEMIKSRGPISRVEISSITGLSRSTCSMLVDELLASKLIIETGKSKSSGGRKPVLLSINFDAGFVIGIKLMVETIEAALVDLRGNAIQIISENIPENTSQSKYLQKLSSVIEKIIQDYDEGKRLFGIGIGMSGLVDSENGVLIE